MIELDIFLNPILIYAIPAATGALIYFALNFKYKNLILDLPHITTALTHSFIYGALIIFFEVFLLSKSTNIVFEQVLRNLLIIQSLLGLFSTIVFLIIKKGKVKVDFKDMFVFVGIMILGALGYYVWRYNSPPTATLDWDMFMHQSLISILRNGNFDFNPLRLSDTFNFYSYSPMFHTLVLNAQVFLENIDVTRYWYSLQFWHYISTIIASYVIGYAVTRKRRVGIVSAVIGAFVFESFIAYTSFFFLPQTLSATVLTLFIAGEILRFRETKKIIEFSTVAGVCFFALSHMVIGFAGLSIILFSIVYLRTFKNKQKIIWHRGLTMTFLLLIPAAIYISTNIDLSFLNRGEAESFTLLLSDKYNYMKQFYSYSLLLLFPIGTFYILRKKPKTNETLVLLIALGSIAITLANWPYVLKFYTIGRYFIHVIMALGFWYLIDRFEKITINAMVISIFAISMFIVFITNTAEFKQNIIYDEIATHVSPAELETSHFLKNTYKDQNVMIVSDPTTMHLMEGLTQINTPGGGFTSLATRKTLSKIYFSRDSSRMRDTIFSITDITVNKKPEKILFVVSGRFSTWQLAEMEQKEGIVYNVWQPIDLTFRDYEFIAFIDKIPAFKKVYKTPEIVVYEINQQ